MAAENDHNKEIARRYAEEVWGEGNIDMMDELLAEDQIYHDPTFSGTEPVDEFKEFIRQYHTTFPDLQFEVEGIITEADMVAFWGLASGTHEGKFMNIPPTGNEIDVMVITIVRIENGKIAERWANLDLFGLLQQLDIDPLATY